MEGLRRIVRRLVKTKERVIFALMVMVLIWCIVQIFMPPVGSKDDNPQPPLPVQADDPEPLQAMPNTPLDAFAEIGVGTFTVPGEAVVGPEEEPDEGIPDIRFVGIEMIGAETAKTPYAKMSVDGGSERLIRQGQHFARRQALLEEVDVEGNKIVFRWLPTGRKYVREATG